MQEKITTIEGGQKNSIPQEKGYQIPEAELQKATEKFFTFLNIKDEPAPADVIFILGGSSLEPVRKAAELYKAGYAPKIAFISTGGKFGGEKVWGIPENEKYKQVLVGEMGVPPEAIITEGLTTNTLAEAQKAIPFLENHEIVPRKMILVSRPIHQRRAYATFKQQHPDIQYVNCPANEEFVWNDIETQQRLVQEAERLLDYSQRKHDIEKQEIPHDVLMAAVTIRGVLRDNDLYTPRKKPERAPLSK